MQTAVKTPSAIFNMPQRLLVPLFQRPYVWNEEDQWEPLWLDLQRIAERQLAGATSGTPHFLGAVVVQAVTNQIGDLAANIVIDGQQRLTTLQLLFDAIHLIAEKVGATNAAKRLLDLTRNDESYCSKPEDRFKIWPTNHDRPAFNEVMAAVPPFNYEQLQHRNSRIIKAHEYFSDVVEEFVRSDGEEHCIDRLNTLERAARELLQIVVIQLDAEENAQEIFEALNGRGSILTAADLIKNFIFQRLHEQGADVERIYQSHWQEFESAFWEQEVASGRVKQQLSSLFLNHWLNAQTDDEFTVREVFTRFKRYALYDVDDSIVQLLARLKSAATFYKQFVEATESKQPATNRFELFAYRVGVLEADVMRILVLWLTDATRDKKSHLPAKVFDCCFELLETWMVRRMLLRLNTKSMTRSIKELVRTLEANDRNRADEVIERFITTQNATASYMPDDEEIRAELSSTATYRRLMRGRLRMVLEAIEDHLNGFKKGANALSANRIPTRILTIEHLMPQEWQAFWPESSEAEVNQRQIRIHQLGNLTLLRQTLNSKVSNGAWVGAKGKLEALQQHGQLSMVADILRNRPSEWTDGDIDARTQRMVDVLLEIWPSPAGYRSNIHTVVTRTGAYIIVLDLISSGMLESGQVLVPTRTGFEDKHATITSDGSIVVDGTSYTTPSGAARVLMHGKAVNGWGFWAVGEKNGLTLSAIRMRLKRQLDPEAEDDDSTEEEGVGESSSILETRYQFWSAFIQYAVDSDVPFKVGSPTRNRSKMVGVLSKDVYLMAVAASFSLDSTSPGPELRVEVWFRDASVHFVRLHADKADIEQEYGEALVWYNDPGTKSARLCARMKANITDEGRWPEYLEWLVDNVVKMRDVLSGRLTN